MTSVIVNDASCLIDLHKGRLPHVVGRLSYSFVIPLPFARRNSWHLQTANGRCWTTQVLKSAIFHPFK